MGIMTRYLCGLLLEECEHVLSHVSHGRRGELAVGAEVGQVLRLVHRVLLHKAVQVVAHQDLGNLERILDKITLNIFFIRSFRNLAHEVVKPVVHAGEDVDGLLVVVQSETDAWML